MLLHSGMVSASVHEVSSRRIQLSVFSLNQVDPTESSKGGLCSLFPLQEELIETYDKITLGV